MKTEALKSVVCVGFTPCVQRILMFDYVGLGRVNRAKNVAVCVGGKGANTARVVRQLGGRSLHVGFAGGGNGRIFEQLMDNEGIVCRHVETTGETRICQTLVVEGGAGETTELVEEMPAVSADEWGRMEQLFAELDLSGVVTISGKLPAGAPSDAYARLVRAVNGQGGKVILDAPGEPMLLALAEGPFMVKVNLEELGAAGMMSRDALAAGAESVLITNGADQVEYRSADKRMRFFPPKIAAVNPVGSGDSVTAGVAFELAQGKPVYEAILTGLACGAANALNLVCGLVKPDDVKRLRKELRVYFS